MLPNMFSNLQELDLDCKQHSLKSDSGLADADLFGRPVGEHHGEFQVTFSGGIAEVRSEDQSLDALLARADQALYRAKNQGRDRIELG